MLRHAYQSLLFLLAEFAGIGSSLTYPLLFPKPVGLEMSADRCFIGGEFRIDHSSSTTSSMLHNTMSRISNSIGLLLNVAHDRENPPCLPKFCSFAVTDDTEVPWFTVPEDEWYEISFSDSGCVISCKKPYGCMHGAKTFAQMIDPVIGGTLPREFTISDRPTFAHRGLLIDSSRHFLSIQTIKDMLDMMSESKLNVLHWHLTDDHSFPISLPKYPELANMGAYSPKAIYSTDSIKEIVQYARERGVKILPEIDMPGHTLSWFKSHPELKESANDVIDPTRDESYSFIKGVINDTITLFNTTVIHIGGDEVNAGWSRDKINYWLSKIHGIAETLNITVIMWDDFLKPLNDDENMATKYPRFKWHMWERPWSETVEFSRNNSGTLFSSAFYLDHLQLDWTKLYDVNLNREGGGQVAGAEACMWGEWVDDSNVLQRTWPRAAAVAERLWSADNSGNFADATMRLAKWRCRLREFWNYKFIEPVGRVMAASPDKIWVENTDKAQWYCAEADLVVTETDAAASACIAPDLGRTGAHTVAIEDHRVVEESE